MGNTPYNISASEGANSELILQKNIERDIFLIFDTFTFEVMTQQL